MFNDADLSGNLFGLAPLVNLGYTATYSRNGLSISDDHHQTVIYGTKSPSDNVWRFSFPRHSPHSARIVVRHEQDAELVLYATASLGFPTFKTMYHAVNMGWLTNYPGLNPKMLRRNKPHSPATGLGHITASRSNVRSTRPRTVTLSGYPSHLASLAKTSSPHDPALEYLDHYDLKDLPDTILRCSLKPSSEFRRDAIYSDLPGAFPVRAKDGTQYLLLSVYKGYIHVEPSASRTTAHLCSAYLATYQFFRNLGHKLKVQILDNEKSPALLDFFASQHIAYH